MICFQIHSFSAENRRHPRIARIGLGVAAALSAGLVVPDVASAQGGLEEIVVTARFREENLQDIPLAISAISADALDANGATSVVDVGDWAPNVVIDQLGSGYGPTLAASVFAFSGTPRSVAFRSMRSQGTESS